MTKAEKPVKVDADQSARFIETAKKTGADESGKKFEKAFKKLAPAAKKRKVSSR